MVKRTFGVDAPPAPPAPPRPAAQEHKTVACACGDEFPIDSYGAGFLDAKGKCFGCDAADCTAPARIVTGPCGQCKDSRVPCQCSLDTILKERGLVAVNRESFQTMLNKIAAVRTPSCWCATCDTATSPFGIRTRMSLCPQCGDKRCPRAQHHDSDCFASPKEPAP